MSKSKTNREKKARATSTMRRKTDILELFSNARRDKTFLKISAPMVRYSKLEFRTLLRKNAVDLCFTPMIMSDSFCQSDLARQNEFTTNLDDTPLIVQFAAKDSIDLWTAAELVSPYCDGIDLNCGCPQRWAVTSGYGCAVLKNPELLADMIRTLRRNLPATFTVSIKMRLLNKENAVPTIELCRQLEMCGASFVAVHGRTQWQKTCEPVDTFAIGEIKKSLGIPVIGNGDIRTLEQARQMFEATATDGVMAARGLLSNPGLFAGTASTTEQCIRDWIGLAAAAGSRMSFQCFHHHLTFMMEASLKRRLRVTFNNFTKKDDVLRFLDTELNIAGGTATGAGIFLPENTKCTYNNEIYAMRKRCYNDESKTAATPTTNGKFFEQFASNSSSECDDLDFMDATIFDT